jgi:predicted helicase
MSLILPSYRTRYEEFLKIDFPGIPLPMDIEKFKNLSELGKELVELHLLRHPSLRETNVGFPESGTNKVEKVKYDEENRRVYFNKTQYFEGISKEVWEYRIGAYQVLDKYLKDRKRRKLSSKETFMTRGDTHENENAFSYQIEHYMRVAKAIKRTMEAQGKVDGRLSDIWEIYFFIICNSFLYIASFY